jgi:hypothetical protein
MKEITYDRVTGDFALYLYGEFVGYAFTFAEGERTLDALAFDLLEQATKRQEQHIALETKGASIC